jgi:hypothetical protein
VVVAGTGISVSLPTPGAGLGGDAPGPALQFSLGFLVGGGLDRGALTANSAAGADLRARLARAVRGPCQ